MTGIEYCVMHSSWPCQRDLSDCTRYVLQQSDNSKQDDGSTNSDMHVFTLNGTTSDPESPCTIQLKCKQQYAVALTGGEIISESRTIEMYDISGAYLLSCRGQFLQRTDGDEGTRNLFSCRFSLDEPVFALTIKFLSLQGKRECDVSRLMFFISQSEVRHPSFQPKKRSGNINLEKVKGYLHSMGDHIAPDASDLLKSVEQFQQSQMSGLGQLQSVLSRLGTTTSADSATENQLGGMSALVSMMSQLDQSPEASNGQESGEFDKGMMYRMLKDVCGKVTHMRNCKTKSAMETAEPLEQQGTNSSFRPASIPVPTIPLHSEKSGNGLTIESVRLTFEKMLTEQMHETEERLRSYIDEKFSQMEAHLTKKLDELIINTKGNLKCDKEKSTYSCIASQMSTQILDTVICEICESRSKQMTTETGKGQIGNNNANSDGIELD